MPNVNKVILVGHLGRDPEVRHTHDNQKVVNFSVATSERWKDRTSGETKERTEWHRVVIFDPQLAEFAERYLTKGRAVYIEGQLQTRKWQDQSGQERHTTEIVLQRFRGELVLLGGRGDGPAEIPGSEEPPASSPKTAAPARGKSSLAEELDDEIPF